uniref:AGC-kinase C-terminal domain-containing protein n=1 Tax=Panagrellus redivivus TaxID=6233 RepID=A0A7E4W939_PANRE
MTESGSTESDPSPFGPPCTTDSTTYEAPVQPRTTRAPPFFRRSRTPSSSGSSLSGCQSKKKSNQTGTWFYIVLVLAQQFFRSPIELALSKRAIKTDPFVDPSGFSPSEAPLPKMYPQNVEHAPNAEQNLGKHELFDPMIGKFTVDFNENPFFRSKMRWRNDAELAAYAWQTRGMAPNVNMLMTESQMPNYHATSDRACSSSSYGVSSRDPSLLDYDVIDVTWRNDIEREKNRLPEVAAQAQPSQSTTTNVVENQYERDLQVLHEKGFISQA